MQNVYYYPIEFKCHRYHGDLIEDADFLHSMNRSFMPFPMLSYFLRKILNNHLLIPQMIIQ